MYVRPALYWVGVAGNHPPFSSQSGLVLGIADGCFCNRDASFFAVFSLDLYLQPNLR